MERIPICRKKSPDCAARQLCPACVDQAECLSGAGVAKGGNLSQRLECFERTVRESEHLSWGAPSLSIYSWNLEGAAGWLQGQHIGTWEMPGVDMRVLGSGQMTWGFRCCTLSEI